MEFHILESSGGYPQRYHCTIVASNGKTLFSTEQYFNKADAEAAARSVKANAANARIVDKTRSAASYRW
jgi:uncharacterized protein YegP (UPF0339 family)